MLNINTHQYYFKDKNVIKNTIKKSIENVEKEREWKETKDCFINRRGVDLDLLQRDNTLVMIDESAKVKNWKPASMEILQENFGLKKKNIFSSNDVSELFEFDIVSKNDRNSELWRREKRKKLIDNAQHTSEKAQLLKKMYSPASTHFRTLVALAEPCGKSFLKTKHWEIDQSDVEGAGFGIFAKKNIPRGQPMGFYGVYAMTDGVFESLNNRVKNKYKDYLMACPCVGWRDKPNTKDVVCLPFNTDGKLIQNINKSPFYKEEKIEYTPFINDNSKPNEWNCCSFSVPCFGSMIPEFQNSITQEIWIIAVSDIKKGEELHLPYGSSYWKDKNIPEFHDPYYDECFSEIATDIPDHVDSWCKKTFQSLLNNNTSLQEIDVLEDMAYHLKDFKSLLS